MNHLNFLLTFIIPLIDVLIPQKNKIVQVKKKLKNGCMIKLLLLDTLNKLLILKIKQIINHFHIHISNLIIFHYKKDLEVMYFINKCTINTKREKIGGVYHGYMTLKILLNISQ